METGTGRQVETVIIGGGISGLGCARTLADAGRDFVLVSDRLGGRIFTSEDSGANLGASYVTSDYRNLRRYVDRGERIWMRDVFFRDRNRLINIFHRSSAGRIGALGRLYRELVAFRAHLSALRRRSRLRCQKELMEEDPLLNRATREPATEFIRRNRLEELDEVFINPIVRSTVFVPSEEVNTFYYLAVLFPIVLRTWTADCRQTVPRLTRGCSDRIVPGKARAVERTESGLFRTATADGEVTSQNLVVATPPHNTREFLPELDQAQEDGVREIPMSTLHVKGVRRREYLPGKTVFLRPGEHVVTVLWPQRSGVEILFSHTPDPDLSPYYESVESVRVVSWKTAIVLSGASWRPLNPRPSLYTIGDHNICGLEDSFLTGLFAAERIIRA